MFLPTRVALLGPSLTLPSETPYLTRSTSIMCQDVYYTYDCGHRIANFPAVLRCDKGVKSGFDC